MLFQDTVYIDVFPKVCAVSPPLIVIALFSWLEMRVDEFYLHFIPFKQ